jgi:hypothetical protein
MAKGGVIDKILIAGILGSKNIIASVSPDKTELQPSKPENGLKENMSEK